MTVQEQQQKIREGLAERAYQKRWPQGNWATANSRSMIWAYRKAHEDIAFLADNNVVIAREGELGIYPLVEPATEPVEADG